MRSRRIAVALVKLDMSGPVSFGDPQRELVQNRMRRAISEAKNDEILVDIPVAKDPGGRAIVRGTSVFGALRNHLATFMVIGGAKLRLRGIDSVEAGKRDGRRATLADLLCGSEPEELNTQGKPALRPSALRLVSSDLTQGTASDGNARTAVSRTLGAAEARKLFRRAEVKDARIQLILQLDLAILEANCAAIAPTAAPLAVAEDFAEVLRRWQPLLGGRVGTGWGRATVGELNWGVADPLGLDTLLSASSTIDVMSSIATTPVAQGRELASCIAPPDASTWSLDVPLVCGDFLLLDPREQPTERRNNRAVTGDRVTGSSWRGLLRARSEFILRSCGIEACLSSEGEKICGQCPGCALFGWAPGPRSKAHGIGSRGLVGFGDSEVTGTKATLDHAPVDRFTGGAADGKLFTRESWAPGSTVTLSIYQLAPDRPLPEWGKHLLVLAIRDLRQGLVGVGNSTTRGYGTVELDTSATLPDVPDSWFESVPHMGSEVMT